MILNNNLFTIINRNISDTKAEFRIKLNVEHFIYQAHFPDNPITPGVCLIQMATELFGLVKDASFSLKTLKNVKFTAALSPLEFPEADFALEFTPNEIGWHLKVLIKESETVFAKISMVLV